MREDPSEFERIARMVGKIRMGMKLATYAQEKYPGLKDKYPQEYEAFYLLLHEAWTTAMELFITQQQADEILSAATKLYNLAIKATKDAQNQQGT